jgi:hypothetical protein
MPRTSIFVWELMSGNCQGAIKFSPKTTKITLMNALRDLMVIAIIIVSLLVSGCINPANTGQGPRVPVITRETTPADGLLPSQATSNQVVPAVLNDTKMKSLLIQAGNRLNRSLQSLDENVTAAATSLGTAGITGPEALGLLSNLTSSPSVVDAVTVTPEGNIAAVMPEKYQDVIGSSVANQTHIIRSFATGEPVLSGEFLTVEGFNSAALVYPVHSRNGTVIGLISVPFLPERLLSDAVGPLINGTGYEVTVLQTDGRIIYATNASQTGLMTFDDPLFTSRPDIIRFARLVVSNESGSGTYLTGQNLTVENYWTTVSLHGTPWRIIIDTVRE